MEAVGLTTEAADLPRVPEVSSVTPSEILPCHSLNVLMTRVWLDSTASEVIGQ